MASFFGQLEPCIRPEYPYYGKIYEDEYSRSILGNSTESGAETNSAAADSDTTLQNKLNDFCKVDKRRSINRLLESIKTRVDAWLTAVGEQPEVQSLVALFHENELDSTSRYIPRCKS